MKKKVLFIDRDGTLLREPADKQIDSFEKMEFLPGCISALAAIARETDFELVLVSNQDGLGTDSFPEKTFWPVQNMLLKLLKTEGIVFSAIHIDPSFPEENSPNRKPCIGMMKRYLQGDYDLENSYVIGDRLTDIQFAKNLACQAIFLNETADLPKGVALHAKKWVEIWEFLRFPPRKVIHSRCTAETDVSIVLNLDGDGNFEISTGIGFFDHMLAQVAKHSGIDLQIKAKGDLYVDEHHTVEDVGIALGEALRAALANKDSISRYGFFLPMDESEAQVAIDFSGRAYLQWHGNFTRERIG
ncbi:MAG TPA: histidinol-phosphatase, partial [Candidatus Marinimicrobia bacterium]|nr:histidinol-phosphatase [Candidatus Neomarinimicrobiota bacterium]